MSSTLSLSNAGALLRRAARRRAESAAGTARSSRSTVLTAGEVASLCEVSTRTVSKWFDIGNLDGYRLPGSKDRRIPLVALVRFLESHRMPQARLFLAGTLVVSAVDYLPPGPEVEICRDWFAAGGAIARCLWSVVVLDTALGSGGACTALASLRKDSPGTTVVVLIADDHDPAAWSAADLVLTHDLPPAEVAARIAALPRN